MFLVGGFAVTLVGRAGFTREELPVPVTAPDKRPRAFGICLDAVRFEGIMVERQRLISEVQRGKTGRNNAQIRKKAEDTEGTRLWSPRSGSPDVG
jgi:hypothetical protein